MREILQAGLDNIENNEELIRKSTTLGAITAMDIGIIGFIMREAGVDPTSVSASMGLVGGATGLIAPEIIKGMSLGRPVNQDQQPIIPAINERAKLAKRILLAGTTALASVGANMLMEYMVNTTKDVADVLEPYQPVNLSPYIAAAIGGAVLFTAIIIGQSIIKYGELPQLKHTLKGAVGGAALFTSVPGTTKYLSVFEKEMVSKSNAVNEHLIERIGEHYLFEVPLGVTACATLGLSLGGMLAVGYFAAEGMHKEVVYKHRRNNNNMAGISELMIRKDLGMGLGVLEKLPCEVLKLIAEYASPVPELPQPYSVNMNKLNPYANTIRSVQAIKFIRQRIKEEEEDTGRLALQVTSNAQQPGTAYNLIEEGRSSISFPEEKNEENSFSDRVNRGRSLSASGYELVQMEEGDFNAGQHVQRINNRRQNLNSIV